MSDDEKPALGRDAILAADDMRIEAVEVPEWGGVVHVRTMSGHERDDFEAEQDTRKGRSSLEDFRARWALCIVCDEKGKLLFHRDDLDALTAKSGTALDRIFDAGRKLNPITEKDIKELLGNSEGGRSAGSGSA